MEYKLVNDSEIEKELEISIPLSELERLINDETDRVQKELAIDGFRKGRVPRTLIKSKYGDSLRAQAMDRLVKESYLSVLSEKKWRPASQAELKQIDEGDPIKFSLAIEVIPEFSVDNYLNIEIFKESPIPDDFLLEQGLNALKQEHAVIKEVERPAVVDDLMTLDIEIIEKGRSRYENDQTVRIGDRSIPDELNRALVGMKKAEKKEIEVGEKTYRIKVKTIKENILPQIDEDFAIRLKFANLEELKSKLLENIKKQEEKRIEEELKESISQVLLQRVKFQIPNSLTQREYVKILKDYGLPDSESNKERFWNVAEKRIRFNLILEKIAEKENLRVSEKEIMDLITKMGMKLAEQNRGEVIEYLGSILNREKTLTYLYENARISEKGRIITPKEVANDTHSVRH